MKNMKLILALAMMLVGGKVMTMDTDAILNVLNLIPGEDTKLLGVPVGKLKGPAETGIGMYNVVKNFTKNVDEVSTDLKEAYAAGQATVKALGVDPKDKQFRKNPNYLLNKLKKAENPKEQDELILQFISAVFTPKDDKGGRVLDENGKPVQGSLYEMADFIVTLNNSFTNPAMKVAEIIPAVKDKMQITTKAGSKVPFSTVLEPTMNLFDDIVQALVIIMPLVEQRLKGAPAAVTELEF